MTGANLQPYLTTICDKSNQLKQLYQNVAIVLPVYNVANYLPECLNSILGQTYKSFMVFAIDDGSTDDSGKILDEYASNNKKIHVVHKPNGGVSSARNVALNAIFSSNLEFDYLQFTDPDDRIPPNFLENMVETFRVEKCDLVLCPKIPFDKSGPTEFTSTNKRIIKTDELIEMELKHESPFFSRSLLNKLFPIKRFNFPRFDETLKTSEDTDWFMRIILDIKTCVLTQDTHYQYRRRKSSLINTSGFSKNFHTWENLMNRDFKKYSTKNQKLLYANLIDSFCQEIHHMFSIKSDSSIIKRTISDRLSVIDIYRDFTEIDNKSWKRIKRFRVLPFFLLGFYEKRKIKKSNLDKNKNQSNYFD